MEKYLLLILLFFYGCGGGSQHSCGNGCTDSKVLAVSECGGFLDRNSTGIDFAKDKSYVAYDFNNKSKTIILTHYNAAMGCDTNHSSTTVNSSWLGPISIGYGGLTYNKSCYCLGDIKTEIKLTHPIKDFTQYPIQIKDKRKGVIDPEIHFIIDSENNKSGVVSFTRANPPWKSCEAPVTLQSRIEQEGVIMELNITRCEIENQPIKIKAVVTNTNSYPVMYKMSNIGDPAIYTSVLNQHFLSKKPVNKNDLQMGEFLINYANIQEGEQIVRETIWSNRLTSNLITPNGDYNITAQFHYIGNADKIDTSNLVASNPITAAINFTKQHSYAFITPDEVFDTILDDIEIKSWLDNHEGMLCLNFSKGNVLKYTNGVWIKSAMNKQYELDLQTGKECNIQLKEDKLYHFSIYDKYYTPNRMSKKIDAIKNTL